MQMSDPRQVVYTYLLDSSQLGDDVAIPDSIGILKEQQVDRLIYFIVTYKTQLQEQRYGCM